VEKKILKSDITRLNEGDGTRWDFFDRVWVSFEFKLILRLMIFD
jgi:hypothetical protein